MTIPARKNIVPTEKSVPLRYHLATDSYILSNVQGYYHLFVTSPTSFTTPLVLTRLFWVRQFKKRRNFHATRSHIDYLRDEVLRTSTWFFRKNQEDHAQWSPKKQVYFDNMVLQLECRINSNALLRAVFFDDFAHWVVHTYLLSFALFLPFLQRSSSSYSLPRHKCYLRIKLSIKSIKWEA